MQGKCSIHYYQNVSQSCFQIYERESKEAIKYQFPFFYDFNITYNIFFRFSKDVANLNQHLPWDLPVLSLKTSIPGLDHITQRSDLQLLLAQVWIGW